MGKSVLFLTYDGLSDPLGQSQILPYLKGLAAKGNSICILSCEKKDQLKQHQNHINQDLHKVGIQWKFVFYSKRPPIFSTFFDLWKMKRIALKWQNERQFDIVHCRTIIPFPIVLALKKKSIRFLFDFRGFWSQERVDGKLWNLSNPIYRVLFYYLQKQENRAYQLADHVVSLTHNAKNFLLHEKNLKDNKISVIPCSVDTKHFSFNSDKTNENQLKINLGLEKKNPVVTYVGSLGTRYKMEEMLLCFQQIQKEHPLAVFLIITKSDTSELVSLAIRLKIQDAIVLHSSNYLDIQKYIALADVALYFIEAGKSGKAVSPTKQAEFLSMGIPIITNDGIGDSTSLIEKEKIGYVCKEFSEKEYQKAAKTLNALLQIDKNKLRNIAIQNFALEKGIEKYDAIYTNLD